MAFAFTICGLAVLALAAPPTPRTLSGKWHIGDGEGYNVDLTLRPDFRYGAVWTGCLGTYGTAKGRWHLRPRTDIHAHRGDRYDAEALAQSDCNLR